MIDVTSLSGHSPQACPLLTALHFGEIGFGRGAQNLVTDHDGEAS